MVEEVVAVGRTLKDLRQRQEAAKLIFTHVRWQVAEVVSDRVAAVAVGYSVRTSLYLQNSQRVPSTVVVESGFAGSVGFARTAQS